MCFPSALADLSRARIPDCITLNNTRIDRKKDRKIPFAGKIFQFIIDETALHVRLFSEDYFLSSHTNEGSFGIISSSTGVYPVTRGEIAMFKDIRVKEQRCSLYKVKFNLQKVNVIIYINKWFSLYSYAETLMLVIFFSCSDMFTLLCFLQRRLV